jgi:DNA-binding MarR family transcriptional regulator
VALSQPDNLLGSLSLAVNDRVAEAILDAAGQPATGAAALVALERLLDGPSIETLARAIGLTSSGTVRLIDRLESAGLANRQVGADGRVSRVVLTAAGRRVAGRVATARGRVLVETLRVLSTSERRQFGQLAGRLLGELVRTKRRHVRWTCRLCDTVACGRPEGRCPVAIAAQSLLP